VDLKKEPLVALDSQIRRDRIKTLGGIGDFKQTLKLLSSLVNDLTGGFRVKALDLTASFDLLVSLIAFCNIRGTDLVSERSFTASQHNTSLEKCRQMGVEMLKYAELLCDGPTFAMPGLTEKQEYKQWTYNNLCRVYFALGAFQKASEYSRMIEATKTDEAGRDELVSITSQIHVALLHSKLGKHNTAVSTLVKTSQRLVQWCARSSRQESWTTFCSSRILTRRYFCSALHLAGVCQYNLSVEYAAVDRMSHALEAAKRAYALALRDANNEPIFFRRCQRTLMALESIARDPGISGKHAVPVILHRLMQAKDQVFSDQVFSLDASHDSNIEGCKTEDCDKDSTSRPSTASSSIRSKVQTIKDARESLNPFKPAGDADATELNIRKFGTWFPPHIALRLVIQAPVNMDQGQDTKSHDTKVGSEGLVCSDALDTLAMPTLFLRVAPSKDGDAGKGEVLDTLLMLALPMEQTECLEILHADNVALLQFVLQHSTKDGFKAVLRAKNSISHAPAKLEQITSLSMRQRMMGLVIICIQTASKLLVQDSNGQQSKSDARWAEKYMDSAQALLFNGTFDFPHFVEMKACVRLLQSTCLCVQGHDHKALWVLSESLRELALETLPKVHAVVLLNMCGLMAKLRQHHQSFQVADAAWTILHIKLGGKQKHDDWCALCFGLAACIAVQLVLLVLLVLLMLLVAQNHLCLIVCVPLLARKTFGAEICACGQLNALHKMRWCLSARVGVGMQSIAQRYFQRALYMHRFE